MAFSWGSSSADGVQICVPARELLKLAVPLCPPETGLLSFSAFNEVVYLSWNEALAPLSPEALGTGTDHPHLCILPGN